MHGPHLWIAKYRDQDFKDVKQIFSSKLDRLPGVQKNMNVQIFPEVKRKKIKIRKFLPAQTTHLLWFGGGKCSKVLGPSWGGHQTRSCLGSNCSGYRVRLGSFCSGSHQEPLGIWLQHIPGITAGWNGPKYYHKKEDSGSLPRAVLCKLLGGEPQWP